MAIRNSFLGTFALAAMFAPTLNAQSSTSLYVPGFDPQPISADIIGVGPDGHTTWALHQGKPAATDTNSYDPFPGTATLIQGPNDAILSYANSAGQLTIVEGCTISDSTLAICTLSGNGRTGTQTENASKLPVAIGATLTGSATILPVPGPSPSSQSGATSPGSGTGFSTGAGTGSGSGSSTSQTASLPSNTNTASSARSVRFTEGHYVHVLSGLVLTIGVGLYW